MNRGRIIRLPVGFRLTKAGKVERCTKHLDISARLRRRASKRVRVVKGKPTGVTKSGLISN
jgi:hypothetical protein